MGLEEEVTWAEGIWSVALLLQEAERGVSFVIGGRLGGGLEWV